ncbi:MAG: hypothetical protein PVH64_09030 [Bacillota bacterium]
MKVKTDLNLKLRPEKQAELKPAVAAPAVSPIIADPSAQARSGEASQPCPLKGLLGKFDSENLIHGIVMAEILGKPRCRGRRR